MVDRGQDVNAEQHREQYRKVQMNGQEHKGQPASPAAPAKTVALETRIAAWLISKTGAAITKGWKRRARPGSWECTEVAAARARKL